MALALILKSSWRTLVFSKIIKPAVYIQTKRLYPIFYRDPDKNLLSKPKVEYVLRRNMSHDHTKMWILEKAVSVSLIALFPSTFLLFPGEQFMDDALAIFVVAHMFWGLEACIADYVRPIVVGDLLPKLTIIALYLVCFATVGGLLHYNHNCLGISCTCKKIWQKQPEKKN